MYETLVAALRNVNEYDSGYAKLMYDAADAIEAQDRHILTLQHEMMAEAESHIAEVNRLNKQVEEISSGSITAKEMQIGLSVGVSLSVGLAMLRMLTGISIMWFLIPGYALAIVMTFFVSDMFTGVAFDSGGVASGPMASTFILAFMLGVSRGVGGNPAVDAFGCIAMIAMTPLIAIQLLGIIFSRKTGEHK